MHVVAASNGRGPFAVAADNIDKARLVPDWAALGYAPARDLPGGDARPGKPGRKAPGRRAARPRRD